MPDSLRYAAQEQTASYVELRLGTLLDLANWANQRIDALSKGMAQKVQFISAVVARPKLLVLDEPFTGLDPLNMEVLKDAVVALHRGGTTVIFSTHDMDIAERMCDTIFMICRGRKVLDGTLESIQAEYGQDTIRVRLGEKGDRSNLPERPEGCCAQIGPVPFLQIDNLPGVLKVNEYGRYTELRMEHDADTQAILRELMRRGRVEHFELARPSLHDVFVRIAGAEAQPAEEASRA